ncbi:MAG TPA: c-type cytochrome [Casimicrobiaceae bacterium]|jgi:cytochrome c5
MTSDPHSSPIKTPKQLVIVVLLAFLVPITLIVLITQLVTSGPHTERDAKNEDSRVLERIQPVGTVVMAEAGGPKGNLTGQQVFEQVCTTCHAAGIAGAPKVGDAAAWKPRIAEGADTLFKHAIAGFQGKTGMMPPKGGNTDLADVEVERAVVYMANKSGGNLKEPPAPAPTQAATAGSVPAGSVGVATAAPGTSPATSREASTAAPGAPAAPVPSGSPPGAAAQAQPTAGGKPDGKKVFETTCNVCHGAGIAGAPKFGDKAAWAPRLAEGINTLHQHAIHGFQGKGGVMPPKGGNTALSDAEVMAAVDYMAAAAK